MPKRTLTGRVLSNSNDKTVTVLVERRVAHPVLRKTIRKSKKYTAHDAGNTAQVGDMIRISECRPISRTKCWEVIEGQPGS